MRTQLNVRVAKRLKSLIDRDKASTGRTNDILVEVALENFFTKYSPEQRSVFYKNHYRVPHAREN